MTTTAYISDRPYQLVHPQCDSIKRIFVFQPSIKNLDDLEILFKNVEKVLNVVGYFSFAGVFVRVCLATTQFFLMILLQHESHQMEFHHSSNIDLKREYNTRAECYLKHGIANFARSFFESSALSGIVLFGYDLVKRVSYPSEINNFFNF